MMNSDLEGLFNYVEANPLDEAGWAALADCLMEEGDSVGYWYCNPASGVVWQQIRWQDKSDWAFKNFDTDEFVVRLRTEFRRACAEEGLHWVRTGQHLPDPDGDYETKMANYLSDLRLKLSVVERMFRTRDPKSTAKPRVVWK
jgi:hypothetical protein